MADLGIVTEVLAVIVIAILIFLLTGSVVINRYEVGIRTRKLFGTKMPQGQIIARESDQIGIQADTLMPGWYWFNPIIWKVEKERVIVIEENKVGVVESVDGEPLPTGRLLGDAVDCNHFQDAKTFLDNHGKKGPQIAILRPGTYRINTMAFTINTKPVTKIDQEKTGVIKATDGQPLPSGLIIAPKPNDDSHRYYQDGQAFIDTGGFRGPQLDTLQPGQYYINPLLFEVTIFDITEVFPGYVAVLRSNVGKELTSTGKLPADIDKDPNYKQPIHEKEEVILTTDKNERGIWAEPIAPGKYNLNPLAFTAFLVPTSAVTIDWASGTDIRTEEIGVVEKAIGKIAGRRVVRTEEEGHRGPPREDVETEKATEFFKFSQLTLTSQDGFILEADVRMIIRIRPQHASFVIARFGSVKNLIEQIVHPLIDSSFRNKAGEKKAIDFIQSRTDLQKEALEKAKEEFDKYYIEAQNLLISYIKVDANLLKTQTDKEIAIQQKEQYKKQAEAQEENIELQEKTARAQKQKDVIDAKLAIDIAADNAEAARKEAEGIRDSTKYKAEGEAFSAEEVGKGIAKAYEVQAKAIGKNNLAVIKLLGEIADGKVKIVPDFLIQGGDNQGGNIFSAYIATLLKEQVEKDKEEKEV